MSEEPGRLGQAGRDAPARGLRAGRVPRRRRARGGEHLRLHRGGPPGVDRHHSRARRRPPTGGAAGGDGVPGRAPRRPARRGDARGRPGGRLRGAGDPGPASRGHLHRRGAQRRGPPLVRPPEPATSRRRGPLGLCEGGRGVRPALRLLRHPLVPRRATVASRSTWSWPRWTSSVADVHEVVLVAQDLASWGLDRSAPERASRPSAAAASHRGLVRELSQSRRARPAPVPVPLGARRLARRRRRLHGRALLRPVAAARVAVLWSSACGAGATGGGSWSASTPSEPRPPTPPCGRRSSSATPARPRRTTTSSWRSWPRPASTGRASSPSPRSPAPTPRA